MEAQALSVQPQGQIQRRSQLQRMSQLQRRLHFQGLILLLQRYKLLLQSGGVASWTLAATEAPPTIPRPNRVAQVLLPPCLRLEPQNFPNGFSLSLSPWPRTPPEWRAAIVVLSGGRPANQPQRVVVGDFAAARGRAPQVLEELVVAVRLRAGAGANAWRCQSAIPLRSQIDLGTISLRTGLGPRSFLLSHLSLSLSLAPSSCC